MFLGRKIVRLTQGFGFRKVSIILTLFFLYTNGDRKNHLLRHVFLRYHKPRPRLVDAGRCETPFAGQAGESPDWSSDPDACSDS